METTTCHFCSTTGTQLVNTAHWSGSADHATAMTEAHGLYVRVDVCGSATCRDKVRAFPRRPRQARRPRPALYGDFAVVAMMNGISTDGTGRRVR